MVSLNIRISMHMEDYIALASTTSKQLGYYILTLGILAMFQYQYCRTRAQREFDSIA